VGNSPENPYAFTTRLVQVSGGISGGAEGDAGGEQFAVFVRGEPDSGEAFLHTLDPSLPVVIVRFRPEVALREMQLSARSGHSASPNSPSDRLAKL
jgi:hypothetical protein